MIKVKVIKNDILEAEEKIIVHQVNCMGEMNSGVAKSIRNKYTEVFEQYNRYIRKFPTRMFLGWLGYEVQEYTYLDYNAPSDAPQDLFGE